MNKGKKDLYSFNVMEQMPDLAHISLAKKQINFVQANIFCRNGSIDSTYLKAVIKSRGSYSQTVFCGEALI